MIPASLTQVDTCYWNRAGGESRDSLRYIYRTSNPNDPSKAWSALGKTTQKLYTSTVLNFGRQFVSQSAIATMMTVGDSYTVADKYYKNYMGLWVGGGFVVDALAANADDLKATFLVRYSSPTYVSSTLYHGLVTDVWEVWDEKSEEVKTQIHFIDRNGAQATAYLYDNSLLTVGGHDISAGDFIKYIINIDDEIVELGLAYNATSGEWLEGAAVTGAFDDDQIIHGYVLQKNGGVIRVSGTKPLSGDYIGLSEDDKFERLNDTAYTSAQYSATENVPVYVWDPVLKTLTKSTDSEIVPFTQAYTEFSEVVIYAIKGVEKFIVLYK